MKTIIFEILFLIILVFTVWYFLSQKSRKVQYHLKNPDFRQYLEHELKEISGISHYTTNQVLCVNDEKGRLFIYDFFKKAIVDTLDFQADGDYEAVELVGNIAYILESKGTLIAFDLQTKALKSIDCRHVDVQEFEGMAYDALSNSLLLTAKEMKGEKCIFQLDLGTEVLNKKFSISKADIAKNGQEGKDFKPSGLAVHPISREVYVLASDGKKLLVFDQSGNKKQQYNLDKEQFPQPEGICFTPIGELIIASEGKKGKATISFFKPASMI